MYNQSVYALLPAYPTVPSASVTPTDPYLVNKDVSDLELVMARPFLYLQLYARKGQIQDKKIVTSTELHGDWIITNILKYAVETIDVVITEPDGDLVLNYHSVAKSSPKKFVRRPVIAASNGQVVYLLRMEVKLRLVCKRWRNLVNEMSLMQQSTSVIRISDRQFHRGNIPIQALKSNPLFPDENYNVCQITFAGTQSSCTEDCERVRNVRTVLPWTIETFEFRFPPVEGCAIRRINPRCFIAPHCFENSSSGRAVAFMMPSMCRADVGSSFQLSTFTSDPVYDVPPANLLFDFQSWDPKDYGSLPQALADMVHAFSGTSKREFTTLQISMPRTRRTREAIEFAWKRAGRQRYLPARWNPGYLALLNFDAELWGQLCYLSNIVPAEVERVLVMPGMDRCKKLLSGPATGRIRAAPSAKMFEEEHKSEEFDFTIFKHETWQRSGQGSRICGPRVGIQFPLNGRSDRPKESERLAIPQYSLQAAGKTCKRPPKGFVAASTTLDAPSVQSGTRDLTLRWNWYPGERQAWESLREVYFVFESEQHMRTDELKTFETFRTLRGNGYPRAGRSSIEEYRSWLASKVGSNLAHRFFSRDVVIG